MERPMLFLNNSFKLSLLNRYPIVYALNDELTVIGKWNLGKRFVFWIRDIFFNNGELSAKVDGIVQKTFKTMEEKIDEAVNSLSIFSGPKTIKHMFDSRLSLFPEYRQAAENVKNLPKYQIIHDLCNTILFKTRNY